jgi:hypothetical protein
MIFFNHFKIDILGSGGADLMHREQTIDTLSSTSVLSGAVEHMHIGDESEMCPPVQVEQTFGRNDALQKRSSE